MLPTNTYQKSLEHNKSVLNMITKVCAPLINNFPIKYFGYTKFLNSGFYIVLSNNLKFTEIFLEHNNLHKDQAFLEEFTYNTHSHIHKFIWPLQVNKKIIGHNMLFDNNIWNGFNISYYGYDFIETFTFATDRDSVELINFYINYEEVLTKFITHFKSQMYDVIKSDNVKNFIFSEFYKNSVVKSGMSLTDNLTKEYEKYFVASKRNKFFLEINSCEIYLTAKERQCVKLLCQGKTIKGISNQLSLSQRTVESHLNNVKLKTGVRYKTDIIEILSRVIL